MFASIWLITKIYDIIKYLLQYNQRKGPIDSAPGIRCTAW